MSTRHFALILGIILLVVGVAGFVPGLVTHPMPMPETPAPAAGGPAAADVAGSMGYLLGIFPINVLHNLFHVVWGIFGIAAYRSLGGARVFARATAIVYAVLTIMGFIPGLSTTFGLIPLFGNDIWLHALIAIVAAFFGFARSAEVAPVDRDLTGTTAPGRRV